MIFYGITQYDDLTQLHSERPKLYAILAFLSAIGLIWNAEKRNNEQQHMPLGVWVNVSGKQLRHFHFYCPSKWGITLKGKS